MKCGICKTGETHPGRYNTPPVCRAEMLNFQTTYRPRVNSWLLFDNSGETPLLLDEGENT